MYSIPSENISSRAVAGRAVALEASSAAHLPVALAPSPPERARVAAAKGGRGGLVSSCISDRGGCDAPEPSSRYAARVAVYADSVSARSGVKMPPGPGGVRGACRGFPGSSRRRLIREMARVRVRGLCAYFVTLTYPAVWSDDWRRWKRDLASWRKRLARNWPQVLGGVWRVEFQKRGAPHYHLLLWTSGELPPSFKLWLSQSWYEVVGSGDVKHLRAGTQVQSLDSRRAIRLYVSKYVAKVDNGSAPEAWGRNWGFFGAVDREPVIEEEIHISEYVMLRRLAKRWLKSRKSHRYAAYLRKAERLDVLALGVDSTGGDTPTVLVMLDAIRLMRGLEPVYQDYWLWREGSAAGRR